MNAFIRLVVGLALVWSCHAHGQALFTPANSLLTPSYRGTSGSDYSEWDIFEEPYNVANFGDVALGTSAPTLTQTLTDTAFITSGFNIYSFSDATGYVLSNTLAAHPNNVVFQFETLGTFIDYDSLKLNFVSGGNTISLSATNLISESRVITGGFGGFTNRVAAQWDLTGFTFTSYTITFESLGSSTSFNRALLDSSTNAFAAVVPAARTWDGGGGNALWSTAANWTNDSVQPVGGNVTFGASAPASVTLDSARQVGEFTIAKTGSFTLTGSSTLTVNTGIEITSTGTSATISTPLFMGGHNFIDVASGSSLILGGVITGAGTVGSFPAAGIYKIGEGELALTNNNTFQGGVTVDGGTLRITGSNTYTGVTGVISGRLLLQTDALNGSGALGTATSNITLGTGGTGFTAEIILDGARTMARAISPSAGDDVKRLGGINTGAGATFSGAIALSATTTNVRLTAQAATDKVIFSGAISGGVNANQLLVDGAGEVVFSGAAKTYAAATVVQSGMLRLASGTTFSGSGAVNVSSGASLLVDGSLEGTGSSATLTLTGGLVGGTGTIKRALTIDNNDVLSPGNGIGTLSVVQAVTLGGAGRYRFQINDVDAGIGVGWDKINITGALNITATSGNKFVIEVNSLTAGGTSGNVADFDPLGLYSWNLLTASAGITGFNANNFTFDLTGFANSHPGSFFLTQSGNNLMLNYSAVPEPSRMLLGFASLAALALRRRRQPAC